MKDNVYITNVSLTSEYKVVVFIERLILLLPDHLDTLLISYKSKPQINLNKNKINRN